MKRQSAEAAEAMQVQWTALEENLQNSQSSHKQLELELARVSGELQTKTRLLEVIFTFDSKMYTTSYRLASSGQSLGYCIVVYTVLYTV